MIWISKYDTINFWLSWSCQVYFSPVGWGYRIHWLHLWRGLRLSLLEKQGRTHKWCTLVDPHTWPCKSRTTSTNIHSATMWGYGMLSRRPAWVDERLGKVAREGQGYPCYQHDMIMVMMMKTLTKSILILTLNNLMVRFPPWGFGERGVPLQCYCSQVNTYNCMQTNDYY